MGVVTDLKAQAARLGIKAPTAPTLKRYGLTEEEWLGLLADQGWKCPICLRRAATWNTDHHHEAGWRHMPPEQRRRYVRGVLCAYCNHRVVHSRMPADVAQRIADYIAAYERRRDA